MVAFEVARRYPEGVTMEYVDLSANPGAIEASLLEQIERDGMFYPVSAINGRVYADGLVTLPKVIWAIDEEQARMERLASLASAPDA